MMRIRTSLRSLLLAGITAGLTLATVAEARQLNYALGTPSGTPGHEALEYYADQIREISGGDLTVRVFPLSLLSFAEMSAGLRDGVGDIGLVLTPYHPGEYPPINLLSESSMLTTLSEGLEPGKEGIAFGAALSEFIFFNCPDCLDRYQGQNQVYTGHAAGTAYGLMCSTPVVSLDDLRGKRIRVGAGNFSRWAEDLGASPVTMSANEMREAMSQGIVECMTLSSPEIQNYGLGELVSDLTLAVPGGVFPFSAFQTNRDVWQSLTDGQREVLLKGAAKGAAAISWIYYEKAEESLDLVRANNARFHEPEESLLDATRSFIEKDMDTLVAQYENRYGMEDASEMLEAFRPILAKWVERVNSVESRDQLADLYWDHILSRIDPKTWGM